MVTPRRRHGNLAGHRDAPVLWDAYYDGTVQKSCSDEAALARMGALAAIEHACVPLSGAASLADSADFESKGCVRSILDV